MSLNIERYLEESRKLDTTGIQWERAKDYPLEPGALHCIHYMMDIETHTSVYLSELLVSKACMDPVITAFLSCWVYEELWHGEYFAKFLRSYGIDVDPDRAGKLRRGLGFKRPAMVMTILFGSYLIPDFSAVYLTIGALNEMSTLTGYQQLARKTKHPVLIDLLSRIIKDERRHFAFYRSMASQLLESSGRARWMTRFALNNYWRPVGAETKPQEDVDKLAVYLFNDSIGLAAAKKVEDTINKLPGLDGIGLLYKEALLSLKRSGITPPPLATESQVAAEELA
jgi:hypothetical protein